MKKMVLPVTNFDTVPTFKQDEINSAYICGGRGDYPATYKHR